MGAERGGGRLDWRLDWAAEAEAARRVRGEWCVASGCDVASSSSGAGGLITRRPRRFVTRVDATMLLRYTLAGAAQAVVR